MEFTKVHQIMDDAQRRVRYIAELKVEMPESEVFAVNAEVARDFFSGERGNGRGDQEVPVDA